MWAVTWPTPYRFRDPMAGLGIDEEAEGLSFQLDPTGFDRTRALVAARFKERSRDEWAVHFAGSDACVWPVLSPWEAAEHPHNLARAAFVEVDGLVQPALAPPFSRTPTSSPTPLVEDSDPAWACWPDQSSELPAR